MTYNLPDDIDPRGLIYESYRIDGISGAQCRSIFLDWAMGVPVGTEARELVRTLLEHYEKKAPDHPMTKVLRDGLGTAPKAVRRGGRQSRREGGGAG